jgi:hypothetical protein
MKPQQPKKLDVIQEKSINHYDRLGNNSNPILQPLLEQQQQRRRLKKLWPANLIDGWRGFTHWRGPHHDTIDTGGRCLTQHKTQKSHIANTTGTTTKKAKETLASRPN